MPSPQVLSRIRALEEAKGGRKVSRLETWGGITVGALEGGREVNSVGRGAGQQFSRIDSRSTQHSTSNSNNSLINSLNSEAGQQGQDEMDGNAWSLTERVKGASGVETVEYQSCLCKFTHFLILVAGVALVLFVIGLIVAQTIKTIFFPSHNSTTTE